ncbi:MAG: hypothetical protein LBR44_10035 [Clostridiales Family XIII bacterium]|jgi:hypothetical protein|nr:hypothetical protein [Clostridiales Family XIII bacterium]
MEIKIRAKAAGSRRPAIELKSFEITDGLRTSDALVEDVVRRNVRAYNAADVDAPLLRWLAPGEIEDGAALGKVGFGDRKNERQQDEDEAVGVALQAYRDGLFKLLVGEDDVESGAEVRLEEGAVVTFLRLVLLAGRMW